MNLTDFSGHENTPAAAAWARVVRMGWRRASAFTETYRDLVHRQRDIAQWRWEKQVAEELVAYEHHDKLDTALTPEDFVPYPLPAKKGETAPLPLIGAERIKHVPSAYWTQVDFFGGGAE